MNNKSSFIDIINKEGYLLYPFKGISMLPLLDEDNDLVRIEKSNNYSLYDVILFKKNDNYVLHRIIGVNNDLYRVRGDNAVEIDVIKNEDIVGKMVGYYKGDRYISINDEEYQFYLEDNFFHPKKRRKKPIYSSNVEATSFKVNDNVKKAYKALFRYAFDGEFDINDIKSLSKEDFGSLYSLCLYKKSDHVLIDIINKYELKDIDDFIINKLRKTEAVVKSRFLFHDYYKKDISKLLTENNIKHFFIKGAELSDKYKHPLFRSSNDIDIYIDKNDLEKVTELISSTYSIDNYKDESIHRSFSIYKGKALIEVHYALLEESEYASKLLDNPFRYCEMDKDSPYLYHLKKDYYYFYHLAHFIKHINIGEYWISMMMDSYLLKNDVNLSLLKEARLDKFYNALNDTLSIWMENKERSTPLEDIIFRDAFTNYLFVNKKKYSRRSSFILARLFPPKADLEESYPKLTKHTYLYPYYLCIRFFKALFTNRIKKPIKELKTYNSFSNQDIKNIYDEIGLNEYYK